jgi:hypothetical protein
MEGNGHVVISGTLLAFTGEADEEHEKVYSG